MCEIVHVTELILQTSIIRFLFGRQAEEHQYENVIYLFFTVVDALRNLAAHHQDRRRMLIY